MADVSDVDYLIINVVIKIFFTVQNTHHQITAEYPQNAVSQPLTQPYHLTPPQTRTNVVPKDSSTQSNGITQRVYLPPPSYSSQTVGIQASFASSQHVPAAASESKGYKSCLCVRHSADNIPSYHGIPPNPAIAYTSRRNAKYITTVHFNNIPTILNLNTEEHLVQIFIAIND